MKTAVLSLMFFFATTQSFAGDWSFNYLKKLYAKDGDLCFKRCETFMNIFPNQESAWFFAMKIEVDRLAKSPKEKTKSSKINHAVDYAKYFEKNASAELKTLTQWDTVQSWLNGVAVDVRSVFDKANLDVNVKQLDDRWKKYTGNSLEVKTRFVITETKHQKQNETAEGSNAVDEVPKTGNTVNSTASNLAFTGLPKGTENIASGNLKAEKELLIMINKERKRLKMDTLIWNPDLARACRYHAMDMGTQGYFDHHSHDLVDGELIEVGGTFERIGKFYSKTFVNSENIAAGSSTAAGTYEQWFTSPGHYRNMFNPDSKYVGIGMVTVDGGWGSYWVFCTAH